MSNKMPNIVIFNPDQWRGDVLGHLGNSGAQTPFLDRFVSEDAVSFSHAFCQNPVCTPSRCSFMSGWYPHVRGHRSMHHMMKPDEPVMLRTLKDLGYFVWWGGKNDLVSSTTGFDDYCHIKYEPAQAPAPLWGGDIHNRRKGDKSHYSMLKGILPETAGKPYYNDVDWSNINGAIEAIRDRQSLNQPFCLFLPLIYPHPPYAVEERWYDAIDRTKLPSRIGTPVDWTDKPSILKGIWERQQLQYWDENEWNELRAVYYGMCARVDEQFGLVMQALKETGLYDDTAVFFFSDHGDFTGDYGLVEKTQNTFEDCLTRVPFIVKPPKWIPVQPGVREALVELVDFPATVEDMLGIRPLHTHFGRSLLPLIAGETTEHRDAVFCEGGRVKGEYHCMEHESQGDVDNLYYPRLDLQIRDDSPYHTKAVMCRTRRYKYVMRLYELDELYDLEQDPSEETNMIHDPKFQEVARQMRDRILLFFMETGDVVPHMLDAR